MTKQTVITNQEIDDCVHQADKFLRKYLADGNTRDFMPHLICYHRQDFGAPFKTNIVYIANGFPDQKKKEQITFSLGQKSANHAQKHGPLVLAILLAETWRVQYNQDDPALQNRPEPQHDPRRQECITLTYRTLNKDAGGRTYPITRNRAGNITINPLRIETMPNPQNHLLTLLFTAFGQAYLNMHL